MPWEFIGKDATVIVRRSSVSFPDDSNEHGPMLYSEAKKAGHLATSHGTMRVSVDGIAEDGSRFAIQEDAKGRLHRHVEYD